MRTDSRETLAREVLIHGPIGRSALGRRLGLSPASLTRLARPLLERGVFVELGENSDGSVGRPARPLDIAPDLGSFVGVKITGDAAFAVLTDARARVVAEAESVIADVSPSAVVSRVADLIEGLARRDPHPLVGIGVSLGGAVDEDGRVIRAPFLNWTDVGLGALIAEATGTTVTVENDVVALVEAERWFGAGRGRDGFALITIGAGVGYGLVIGGDAVHTREAGVGLGGHIPIDPTGPLCPEGHRGCSSALLTSVGMCAQVGAALGRAVAYEEVLSLAEQGDPAAAAVVDAAARGLGRMIALAANLTMQPTVVLAGDGIGLWRIAAERIVAATGAERDPLAEPVEILVDEAGFRAWARGAAAVAIQAAVARL
ncbi:ROK family transcriptional regulator [Microbacterium pygmaeum]|uniref:Sugar kinase of the NBD/HSP70 family, may contain an N-terminal HTH domain n=1 Tax=Microbacterium pygmaeum TaxID=370764 RepID=A0A1G7WK72_9MICO|nr:ROK family transcriptional regulator [Microbacterium pygmaeum]SDG72258.1 Sugar kinase of the NBD/HSP70 family, may contain an N-terminal HTH domain [Microbacterium pygmaeum]